MNCEHPVAYAGLAASVNQMSAKYAELLTIQQSTQFSGRVFQKTI